MPGGGVGLAATSDVNRIEAPVTWKAYLICAFASFGGIFFGYDSGYINGVTASKTFIHIVEGGNATELTGSNQSLIVSILSAGTFFGAIIANDIADIIICNRGAGTSPSVRLQIHHRDDGREQPRVLPSVHAVGVEK